MKKKIVILGSTGSIGKSLLKILSIYKNNFEIILLTCNKNYKLALKQAKNFKVRNLIIINRESYYKAIKDNKNINLKIFNNFDCIKFIFKKKIDYCLSSISGLDGLKPTIDIIKYTNEIAIANKESIICGWNLINKELKNNKTNFIPVDSEHFSLWYGLKNSFNSKKIEKVYLTASGGPFLNKNPKKIKKVSVEEALNHPNWKMGKKISVDSATIMNKIFEIIEAKKIFNIPYKQIEILIHPKSYVHAIIKFQDGMSKIIIHDTTMEIPIFNSIFYKQEKKLKSSKLNLKKLNDLNFSFTNKKQFPLIKILKVLPNKNSLFETALVAANDELVSNFLNKKINFYDIQSLLLNLIKSKFFQKLKNKNVKNIEEIYKLSNYVRLKVKTLCL